MPPFPRSASFYTAEQRPKLAADSCQRIFVADIKCQLELRIASSEIWTTLYILAEIAYLAGRTEDAQKYRRRERETFAAFVGNRYHIDQQFGQFIATIAVDAQGDEYTRKQIEEVLLMCEQEGWHITNAIQRIWTGKRDWNRLAEDLDAQDALLILRVLETIALTSRLQRCKKCIGTNFCLTTCDNSRVVGT